MTRMRSLHEIVTLKTPAGDVKAIIVGKPIFACSSRWYDVLDFEGERHFNQPEKYIIDFQETRVEEPVIFTGPQLVKGETKKGATQ